MKSVAIIGGGITGLSAAYYLKKQAKETGQSLNVTIFEASPRLGGKIQTIKKDGFIVERGPDSFIKRKPEALELIHELGLDDQVVSNRAGQAFILKHDRLHPIPADSVMGVPTRLKPFLESELLSTDAKAVALNDLFMPKLKEFNDISVGEFFSKRLGQDMVEDLISPLLSGIYAGDIYKLSLKATLPQFIRVHEESDSLILGLKGTRKKTGKSQFATLSSGLETLVDALVSSIGMENIHTRTEIQAVEKQGESFEMTTKGDRSVTADAVILATPLNVCQHLLNNHHALDKEDSAPQTSVATIAMAFPEEAIKMEKQGTGFVVSRKESKAITASTWTHLKWPHTTPDGKALVRCYVGKAGNDSIIDKSDDELTQIAIQDMQSVTAINGEPEFAVVSRWPKAMPQYTVGHKEWLAQAELKIEQDFGNVRLAGAGFDGVGLPDCIRQGKQTAEDIIKSL